MNSSSTYDVIVIGAGIQGAGVAQAAAANGWSTLVIEKHQKPACETSSKSSKLIHGGLRYLETAQVKLVYECLREQKFLLKAAPDIVEKKAFYIPVYQHSKRPRWKIAAGLFIYSMLKGDFLVRDLELSAQLDAQQFKYLNRDQLVGICKYYDAQTNDRILTERVCESAKRHGADFEFGQTVKAIKYHNNQYSVYLNNQSEVHAKSIVNAGGPWVNYIADLIEPVVPGIGVEWVQGVHIVVDRPAFGCCFYLESPQDHRAVFVLPWQGKTMVGTTERYYTGRPDKQVPHPDDVTYLLNVFNRYFPALMATQNDVLETFSGLRVLPKDMSSANERSRETSLLCSPGLPGYVGVYGGKLTAYRANAEKVINLIYPVLPQRISLVDTSTIPLT